MYDPLVEALYAAAFRSRLFCTVLRYNMRWAAHACVLAASGALAPPAAPPTAPQAHGPFTGHAHGRGTQVCRRLKGQKIDPRPRFR